MSGELSLGNDSDLSKGFIDRSRWLAESNNFRKIFC
jgi:hypothetical protein